MSIFNSNQQQRSEFHGKCLLKMTNKLKNNDPSVIVVNGKYYFDFEETIFLHIGDLTVYHFYNDSQNRIQGQHYEFDFFGKLYKYKYETWLSEIMSELILTEVGRIWDLYKDSIKKPEEQIETIKGGL